MRPAPGIAGYGAFDFVAATGHAVEDIALDILGQEGKIIGPVDQAFADDMDHPVRLLHPAGDRDQAGAHHHRTEAFEDAGPDHQISDARLILNLATELINKAEEAVAPREPERVGPFMIVRLQLRLKHEPLDGAVLR